MILANQFTRAVSRCRAKRSYRANPACRIPAGEKYFDSAFHSVFFIISISIKLCATILILYKYHRMVWMVSAWQFLVAIVIRDYSICKQHFPRGSRGKSRWDQKPKMMLNRGEKYVRQRILLPFQPTISDVNDIFGTRYRPRTHPFCDSTRRCRTRIDRQSDRFLNTMFSIPNGFRYYGTWLYLAALQPAHEFGH